MYSFMLSAESRKKKTKNWEEQDFYDSDEDTYLDRTGEIERKRQQRMKKAGKLQEKAETYESLVCYIYTLFNISFFNINFIYLNNIFPAKKTFLSKRSK